MTQPFITRGFVGKRRVSTATAERIPPGQHEVQDFPVLSAGPTPKTRLEQWSFSLEGLVRQPARWTWAEFQQLPAQQLTADIHCVTKWTKLDTHWTGVSLDTLLEHVELDPRAQFLTAFGDDGYTTNMPLPDVLNGRAWVATQYAGQPLTPEHGGPARLLVPALYLWKSAKWVRGLRFMEKDRPGFWESAGYNNHGDPWKEERYTGD